MTLTLMTVVAAAALGGGVAAQVTLVIAFAVAALVLIGLANGAGYVRRVISLYDE